MSKVTQQVSGRVGTPAPAGARTPSYGSGEGGPQKEGRFPARPAARPPRTRSEIWAGALAAGRAVGRRRGPGEGGRSHQTRGAAGRRAGAGSRRSGAGPRRTSVGGGGGGAAGSAGRGRRSLGRQGRRGWGRGPAASPPGSGRPGCARAHLPAGGRGPGLGCGTAKFAASSGLSSGLSSGSTLGPAAAADCGGDCAGARRGRARRALGRGRRAAGRRTKPPFFPPPPSRPSPPLPSPGPPPPPGRGRGGLGQVTRPAASSASVPGGGSESKDVRSRTWFWGGENGDLEGGGGGQRGGEGGLAELEQDVAAGGMGVRLPAGLPAGKGRGGGTQTCTVRERMTGA